MTRYEQRRNEIEELGATTSDAQAVIDAEIMSLARYLSESLTLSYDQIETAVKNWYESPINN